MVNAYTILFEKLSGNLYLNVEINNANSQADAFLLKFVNICTFIYFLIYFLIHFCIIFNSNRTKDSKGVEKKQEQHRGKISKVSPSFACDLCFTRFSFAFFFLLHFFFVGFIHAFGALPLFALRFFALFFRPFRLVSSSRARTNNRVAWKSALKRGARNGTNEADRSGMERVEWNGRGTSARAMCEKDERRRMLGHKWQARN